MSTYQRIARRRKQLPVRLLRQALRVAPSACYAWRYRTRTPAPVPAVQLVVARHGRRYGTRRRQVEVRAEGYPVGRWRVRHVLDAHGLRVLRIRPSSPARTIRRPWQARPCAPPPIACWANRPLLLPTRSGWAILRICPARTATGATWPRGSTANRARSSAGTCARPCPRAWSAGRYAGPWPCANPRLGSWFIPNKAASILSPPSRLRWSHHGALQGMSRRGNCYDNTLSGTTHAESF